MVAYSSSFQSICVYARTSDAIEAMNAFLVNKDVGAHYCGYPQSAFYTLLISVNPIGSSMGLFRFSLS
jgi:hypothetical protein